ncbi:MAG: DegT/DnrJ/EryC1/StrS family aminotransferase [Solirubrobacteraceae bacterium]|nr:DegT/DnrJ/EryC1/StrS family aminotransferase [Solirubrobacteraceae bacterium]
MTQTVPYLDLHAAYDELRTEIDAAIHRVLDSGRYVLGPEVEQFEAELAAHTGTQHAVGVASGLDALELALRALDVGPGDEVIVPSNTYIATWLAVSAVGATIVPVEPDPQTTLIEADAVRAAITPRTAAVLVVHLYGRAADWKPLRELCDAHGLALVEDAAQSHGAERDGRRAGAFGHVGCFSFYPSKNLGALGEAGAISTDDAAVADRVRMLRNYGSEQRYHHLEKGRNSRIDPMQAAVLRAKLPHLDVWNERRRAVGRFYLDALRDVPGLVLPSGAGIDDAHHIFLVRSCERDALRARLTALGIGTEVHYPIPPHRSDAYADLAMPADAFPIANQLADEVFSLPMGPHLGADNAERVAAAVHQATASLTTFAHTA